MEYMPVDPETGCVDPDTSLGFLMNMLTDQKYSFYRENYPNFTKGIIDVVRKHIELDWESEKEEKAKEKAGEKAVEQKEICEPRDKGLTCFKCNSTYRCHLYNSCCDKCSKKIVFINTRALFESCKSNWDSIHQNYIDALKSRFGIVKSQLSCFKKTAAGLFVFCEMEERFKIKAIHYISSSGEHVKCASNSLSMM
jgi:hypothetical protein